MMQEEQIRLYCGIGGETTFNHHSIDVGGYACLSPVYGRDDTVASRRSSVSVPAGVSVIQDSGAFSDGPLHRLSFADALQRQIEHARHYRYEHQISHRASYDLLIDEAWKDHFRHKERWTEEAGVFAIKTTVEAAAYLDAHRDSRIGCIMSAQGVTPSQYLDCAEQVLRYVDVQRDIFALGGWCILGKQPKLLSAFRGTIRQVIPLLAAHKVQRCHIWGVCWAVPLGELLYLCDQYTINLSTDSVGPSTKPVRGEWGYASWRDNSYRRPSVLDTCRNHSCEPDTRCRGHERIRHIHATRDWLANFKEREPRLYHPQPSYNQQRLWEVVS